jgi:hypothetical protein
MIRYPRIGVWIGEREYVVPRGNLRPYEEKK